jgi:hypothetical protein
VALHVPDPLLARMLRGLELRNDPIGPTIAGGVVYLVGSGSAGDSAFDEACVRMPAGCAPLWSMSADNGGTVNFGSVTEDALYVGGRDGNLHVFRRGGGRDLL